MASNFCRNCGFKLTEGKSFCGNCGTKVIRRDAAVAPAPAPAPAPVAEPVPAPAPVAEPVPAPEAAPEAPAMPQPLQTVVTYHPEEPIQADIPAEALNQSPVIEANPVAEPEVVQAEVISSVPAVAETSNMPAPVTTAPVVPAVPAVQAEPAPSPAPSVTAPAPAPKKSHTGLIVGLVCGGVVFITLLGIGLFFMFGGDLFKGTSKGSGTVLDRIEVMQEVASGKNYTVYNEKFSEKIRTARWWDYDGKMKSQGVYYSDLKTLAFSIEVYENTTEKVYYAYYYSEDDNFDAKELSSPKYSEQTIPSYYKDGTAYYNVECKKSLKPGYYCVIVSKDKNFNSPYVVAYARVLEEKSTRW